MRPNAVRLVVLLAAVLAVLAGAGLVSCGPSELARAYDPYMTSVTRLLDEESRFWAQLGAKAEDQQDAAGVERYRAFLAAKARPFYARLETDVAAVVPGHERLGQANAEILAFVRSRKEFVDLELRRLDLIARADALIGVQRLQMAAEEARRAYVLAVGDDVPDPRLADLTAIKDALLQGPYRRAAEGSGEVSDAVDEIRKVVLPRLRRLRDDRYDDDELSRLLRRCVVATEEFFVELEKQLPTVVDATRSATRSEAVQREAEVHRTTFQKLLFEAKRDR